MINVLQKNEPNFREVRDIMAKYLDWVRQIQKKSNKYVHKQGFKTFYSAQQIKYSDGREKQRYDRITSDFEEMIHASIGSIIIYRLAIDPMPVLLMEEEIRTRVGDLMTEPYHSETIQEYIGDEYLEAYKQFSIYKEIRDYFLKQEKQSPAVYYLIHYQYINRGNANEYFDQFHLLSKYDRMAVRMVMASDKVAIVLIEGMFYYQ